MSFNWDYKNDFPLFVFNELLAVFAYESTFENVREWWEGRAAVFADTHSLIRASCVACFYKATYYEPIPNSCMRSNQASEWKRS